MKLKNPPVSVQIDGLPENVISVPTSTNTIKASSINDQSVLISRTQVEV